MKCVAIDTNVLLDHYLERPGAATFAGLVTDYEQGSVEFLIPVVVLLEVEWVLRSYYHFPKLKVIERLHRALAVASPRDPHYPICRSGVEIYARQRGVSFVDCVLVVAAGELGADDLVTHDRSLKRLFQRQ